MRLRIILLVIAISSMVLISFLVPLALVLRTFAADRAVSSATVQAQWMAPLVATLDATSLKLAVAQVNGEYRNQPVTVSCRMAGYSAGPQLAPPECAWPPRGAVSRPRPGAGWRCSWPSRACRGGPP